MSASLRMLHRRRFGLAEESQYSAVVINLTWYTNWIRNRRNPAVYSNCLARAFIVSPTMEYVIIYNNLIWNDTDIERGYIIHTYLHIMHIITIHNIKSRPIRCTRHAHRPQTREYIYKARGCNVIFYPQSWRMKTKY